MTATMTTDFISRSVAAMFRTNLGLKPGERILVATDLPQAPDWIDKNVPWLAAAVARCVLARRMVDIARQEFPSNPIEFLPFPATGRNGAEPEPWVAGRMLTADVVVALTTYSLSHTNARVAATKANIRFASMPEFDACMLEPNGPMAVDHHQMAADCEMFARRLTSAERAMVTSPQGTNLSFRLDGRPGLVDNGIYDSPGAHGNLPAGEAFCAPVEGTAEGTLVVPAGWFPYLDEQMVLEFEMGKVRAIHGGGRVGDDFRSWLDLGSEVPAAVARRNLAELGIGTNPNARRPDNVLEAEKIRGTVHVAVGDNLHMGGAVESDLHEDFVIPEPDLILDDTPVIMAGEWLL